VIEQITPPAGSFVPKTWAAGSSCALAELTVVVIDGWDNNRSKAFHDGLEELATPASRPDRAARASREESWYDITRVGLYGTSAGGQNAMGGLLFHSDFYKVAYSNSGCHDNRMDKIWWNEHWMGWPLGPHYEASSNVVHAGKLKGHLMLVIGEMDTNVDPSSGYQVVNALIQAGKYFDLLVVPNGGHGAVASTRRAQANDFFSGCWAYSPRPGTWVTDSPVVTAPACRATMSWSRVFESPNDPPYVWW
jgi:dienelactone hydrolase